MGCYGVRAIVTGAASGIGRSTAERLTAAGWHVVGIDVRSDMGRDVEPIVGDAADPALLRTALGGVGSLDGLVCCAGIPPQPPWDDPGRWDEIVRVDLSGAYHAVRVAYPALRAAAGSVVFVGSIVGPVEGSSRSPAYAAAKAGLEGLARSMAVIAAADRIRVNVVAPGAINTAFDAALLSAECRRDVPLRRMGTAEEVAALIAWLLTSEASYVTGAVLTVDGGRSVLAAADALRNDV